MSASAPSASAPNDDIVFRGDTEIAYSVRQNDIPGHNFTAVKVTGEDSIYYVYTGVDQGGHNTPSLVQIVTSTNFVDLCALPPKSCKGFSKDGIILFETFNYGGQSQNFVGNGSVTDTFPIDVAQGVSSFNVMQGTWELMGKDGGKIVVNGMTQFGPGYASNMPYPSDKVASIKRIR